MKKCENVGQLPKILKSFLTGVYSGENENAEVWDCQYQEIIDKAKIEKLEPSVIIDKKDTGRAFLCCVGASVRNALLYGSEVSVKPVFYFAELDESRKKQFQYELRTARNKVIQDHKNKLEYDKRIKEAAREGAEKLKNG
jgi:hypothetical protein